MAIAHGRKRAGGKLGKGKEHLRVCFFREVKGGNLKGAKIEAT